MSHGKCDVLSCHICSQPIRVCVLQKLVYNAVCNIPIAPATDLLVRNERRRLDNVNDFIQVSRVLLLLLFAVNRLKTNKKQQF